MLRTVRDADLWALIKDAKKYRIIPYVDKKYYLSVQKIMHNIDIEIPYFVTDYEEDDLRSVYDLLMENKNEIMVIVVKDNFPEARAVLEGLGLSMNSDFKDIQKVSFGASSGVYNYDPICGYNLNIPGEKYSGFKMHGDDSDIKALKIVTLGGSTTDDFFPAFSSWSEIFHNDMQALGINNVVFNGGVTGYSSSEELFKLIRDVICMEPDVILTYSGVNDMEKEGNPYINDYMRQICTFLNESSKQLVSRRKTNAFGITWGNDCMNRWNHPVSFWLNNQKMIHSICECFDIGHMSFYQPNMINGKEKLTNYEKEYILNTCFVGPEKQLLSDVTTKSKSFRKLLNEKIEDIDWIYDFSYIFDNDDVYIDYAHVTELGNRIIAKEILAKCKDLLLEMANRKGKRV